MKWNTLTAIVEGKKEKIDTSTWRSCVSHHLSFKFKFINKVFVQSWPAIFFKAREKKDIYLSDPTAADWKSFKPTARTSPVISPKETERLTYLKGLMILRIVHYQSINKMNKVILSIPLLIIGAFWMLPCVHSVCAPMGKKCCICVPDVTCEPL